MSGAEPRRPFAGLRVLDAATFLAAPFAATLLGEFGAEVIKIEQPGQGDPLRRFGTMTEAGHSLNWASESRNKKTITLDLRKPEGAALMKRLVATADVVMENFRPGTLERWNLVPAALMATDPRLIVVRISGYGQTGPYATRAGFGGIGEAMGGWRALVGTPDRPPSRLGVSIGDSLAGTYGCMGALAALHERQASGRGQIVDATLFESVLQVMEGLVPEYAAAGHVRARSGSVLKGIAPSNVYPCADGALLIAANQDAIFRRLARAMGREELADDARYATHGARGRHQDELDAMIADWTRDQPVAAVEALMEEHAVPAGRMYAAADMLADLHFASRGAIVTVDTAAHGALPMQNAFPQLSRTPGGIASPAPALGADTDAVLAAIGYDGSARADLRTRGVI